MIKFIVGFSLATIAFSSFHHKSEPQACLIANEVDPETGYHMMIKVIDEKPEYYVTGQSWDHLNQEWVDMYPRLIEKRIAPDYVTVTVCPPVGMAP